MLVGKRGEMVLEEQLKFRPVGMGEGGRGAEKLCLPSTQPKNTRNFLFLAVVFKDVTVH